MTTVNLSKMNKNDLEALARKLLEQQKNNAALMVKRNASGGVYIRSEKFVEWSDKKQKSYTAGINIPANTAKVLFNDPTLIEAISKEIDKLS